MKLLVTFLILFVGCTTVSRPSESSAKSYTEKIQYAKDPRTGLCFAFIESQNGHLGNIVSLTCVPCSAISEDLFKPKQDKVDAITGADTRQLRLRRHPTDWSNVICRQDSGNTGRKE